MVPNAFTLAFQRAEAVARPSPLQRLVRRAVRRRLGLIRSINERAK